jgi:hypothetical protein
MVERSRPLRPNPRLGRKATRYCFFLNPHSDLRFTTCPKCRRRTRLRKLPLVISVAPAQLVSLNKACRYCPPCDLLIAHRDEIEEFLAALFGRHRPEFAANSYLVVGTEDRADWLRGMRASLTVEEMLDCLHDFAQVVTFERVRRRDWEPPELP